VTPKFYEEPNLFKTANLRNPIDLSKCRWTVDYPQDLSFIIGIYGGFKGRECGFNTQDVLNLLEIQPELNNQLPATLRNVVLKNIWDVVE
jgi:spore coat polysaccharide biosynthesis protein SpsF (cytidylyltransferase family)